LFQRDRGSSTHETGKVHQRVETPRAPADVKRGRGGARQWVEAPRVHHAWRQSGGAHKQICAHRGSGSCRHLECTGRWQVERAWLTGQKEDGLTLEAIRFPGPITTSKYLEMKSQSNTISARHSFGNPIPLTQFQYQHPNRP
jgi:hypothetical protein